jgi:hypothetical protein
MQVKLTLAQFEILHAHLAKDNRELFLILEANNIEPLIFELDDKVMDEIRDWAMDKQVFLGFHSDYNLNQNGIILESLIDLLYL